jgi:hypothetical protein
VDVSVATLGSDLNSDFDKKDPYNREDSKGFVIDTLEKLNEKFGDIMISSGNAYAIPYAKHVLGVALDSSRYTYASEAIPLFGLPYITDTSITQELRPTWRATCTMKHSRSLKTAHPHTSCWYIATPQNSRKRLLRVLFCGIRYMVRRYG